MRRTILAISVAGAVLTGPAVMACGGLVAPNGTVQLARTSTLAAYHDGVEHYITSFEFIGGGASFGSIVPLPGMPSKVERGGDWTLQRLQRETEPPQRVSNLSAAGGSTAARAQVVYETKIDALDITVVKGGGDEVVAWASDNGFDLSPDASEVFAYYSARSPYFMAAVFDAEEAAERDQARGDGTPIHLTIPTDNPWVPLRILGLGKPGDEIVRADVYLLTEGRPALLPLRAPGWDLERRVEASSGLLDDLRSDKGMSWVPSRAWLTHFTMDAPASTLRYDLAVDVSGSGSPSWEWAGLTVPTTPAPPTPAPTPVPPTPEATATPDQIVAIDDVAAERSLPWTAAAAVLMVGLAVAAAALGLVPRRR